MKKLLVCQSFILLTLLSNAQAVDSIDIAEVQRIESTLAADDMQGRKAFTAASDKAADFISNEFKKIGLETIEGADGYKQSFKMVKTKPVSIFASFNGNAADPKNVVAFTCLPDLTITAQSGFKKVNLRSGANFIKEVTEYSKLKENLLVFVDKGFSEYFGYLSQMNEYLFRSDKSVVFILGSFDTDNYSITTKQEITEVQSANVVGVLPGKSKKQELVIFSGHYDHLGTDKAVDGDSIYNGANDDASGITAVLAMAKYYKAVNKNERTLIFVAFTAEESGGFGSQYFSRQLDPQNVVAMFNVEMIGTESKWGNNSAYITGFDKTNMGKILQKNLEGSHFRFYSDPYPEQQLFFRSDNATLARLGVAAHTISTSKMDSEPNYHKLSDDITTLDMANMTEIIKAIVLSANSIVSGKDTPSRVKMEK